MNPWQILKTISVIFRAKKIWFTKNPINNRVGDGMDPDGQRRAPWVYAADRWLCVLVEPPIHLSSTWLTMLQLP